MKIFNFLKSVFAKKKLLTNISNKKQSIDLSGMIKKISVDLSDFQFLSDNHIRIQNGQKINADNKGAWRGIRVKTSNRNTFYVTMYNMNGNHPVWGDNIQMAEKQMKIIKETDREIIFRGFGTDAMNNSFTDYGLTLHKKNRKINKVSLHLHDRNIDIIYDKADDKEQATTLNEYSDFDNFKNFIHKWNSVLSMDEKLPIAIESDRINNHGTNLYNNEDLTGAIQYFEEAIKLMPNNNDALKNLKICYKKIGEQDKVYDIEKKLNYLS
jgi:tetratricopeptide (TPR) repeat protein